MRFPLRMLLCASLMPLSELAICDEMLVPQVTLPLADYQKLKEAEPKPAATVVERLRLAGTFRNRDLMVVFEGRSVGTRPAVTVLQSSDALAPYGCRGEGLLTRNEGGAFLLTPLGPRFEVACRVGVPFVAGDRVRFTAAAAVLWVESSVEDGELFIGEETGRGREVSLLRLDSRENRTLRSTATGRYRVTLDLDETTFRYELTFRNPNRSRQPFDIALSDEEVQQVQGAAGYEVKGGVLHVDLNPGDSTVIVSGVLKGSTFTPPIEASLQYVLLESHPLVKADVSGGPRRVSPGEVGIPMQYRGGEAFLLKGRENLEWKVTRLEAMQVPSLAVRQSHQRVFIPREGPLLVEREITIENRGTSEVAFDVKEPLFASIAGASMPLTEHGGKLALPLEEGVQQLILQERRAFRQGLGVGYARLSVSDLPVTPTATSLEVRTAADWVPLYAQIGSMKWMRAPRRVAVIWLLLLFVILERTLAGLGLTRSLRFPLAAIVALAGLTSREAFAVIGWMCVFAGFIWLAGRMPVGKLTFRNVAGGLILLGLSVWLVSYLISSAERGSGVRESLGAMGISRTSPGLVSEIAQGPFLANISPVLDATARAAGRAYYMQTAPPPQPPIAQATVIPAAPQPQSPEGGYRGLPVRTVLPEGSSKMTLGVDLLPASDVAAIRVLVVSVVWFLWLKVAILATVALLLFRNRREVLDGIRRQIDRVKQNVSPGPVASVSGAQPA